MDNSLFLHIKKAFLWKTYRTIWCQHIGEHFRVDGDYKVLAIDISTEAAQLKIGKTVVWVKSACLSKVTYK